MNILLGLTGSVASKLGSDIIDACVKQKHAVQVVVTFCGSQFHPDQLYVYRDEDEWSDYQHKGQVLHINLVKWADKFIIAPCSANTLAKIANGICDNLLTCCARAWHFNKPFVIAPSMNTWMWDHPTTQEHIDKVKSWGITVVPPVEKTLFCGDTGIGAMANIEDIVR